MDAEDYTPRRLGNVSEVVTHVKKRFVEMERVMISMKLVG